MSKTADSIDAELIVSCGDNFHVSGVASVSDPLWMSNLEVKHTISLIGIRGTVTLIPLPVN